MIKFPKNVLRSIYLDSKGLEDKNIRNEFLNIFDNIEYIILKKIN